MLASPSKLSVHDFNEVTLFLLGLLKVENPLSLMQSQKAIDENEGLKALLNNEEDVKRLVDNLINLGLHIYECEGQDLNNQTIHSNIKVLQIQNHLFNKLNSQLDSENKIPCPHAVLLKLGALINLREAIHYFNKFEQLGTSDFHQGEVHTSLFVKRKCLNQAADLYSVCEPYVNNILEDKKPVYSDVEAVFKKHLLSFMLIKVELSFEFCVLNYQLHDIDSFNENVLRLNQSVILFNTYIAANPAVRNEELFKTYDDATTDFANVIKDLKNKLQKTPHEDQIIHKMKYAVDEMALTYGFAYTQPATLQTSDVTLEDIIEQIKAVEKLAKKPLCSFYTLFNEHLLLAKRVYQSQSSQQNVFAIATLMQAWNAILIKLNLSNFSTWLLLIESIHLLKTYFFKRVEDSNLHFEYFEDIIKNSTTLNNKLNANVNALDAMEAWINGTNEAPAKPKKKSNQSKKKKKNTATPKELEAAAKAKLEQEKAEQVLREAQVKLEREEQAKRQREEHFKREREKQAKREREEKAKREREVKRAQEEQAKREREEQAQREREEQAKREREEQARREREEQAQREREEQAQREREEQAQREREEQAQRERDEQIKQEQEALAKREQEDLASQQKSIVTQYQQQANANQPFKKNKNPHSSVRYKILQRPQTAAHHEQSIGMLSTKLGKLSITPTDACDLIEAYKKDPVQIFNAINNFQDWSGAKHQAVVNCAQYLSRINFVTFLKKMSALFHNENAVSNLHCCYNLGIIPHIALGLGADWINYFQPTSLVYGFVQSRLQSLGTGAPKDYSVYIVGLFLIANIEKQHLLFASTPSYHDIHFEINSIELVIKQFFSLYEGDVEANIKASVAASLKNILLNDLWPNYREYQMLAQQEYYAQQHFTPFYDDTATEQAQEMDVKKMEVVQPEEVVETKQTFVSFRRRSV